MKNCWMAKAWVCAAAVAVATAAMGAGVALPWEASGETLAEFWSAGDEWVLELGGAPEGVEYQVALLDRMTNGVGSTEMGCLVLEETAAGGTWAATPLAEIATADLIEGIGGDGVWLKTRRAPDVKTRRLRFRMATDGGGLGFALRGVRVAGESGRIRVAFDRAGGFTVLQGEAASVTATLEGGSGGMWFSWEGNNGGTATGDGGETFVIDTSVPGEYWLRAVGGSDGTDGDYAGKIRFRVAAKGAAAAMGTRAAGAGETTLLSEDFSGMTSGSSVDVGTTGYNGWTGSKFYNGTNCLKIGSGSAAGYAQSPVVTNAGAAGRVEYTLRAYGSDSTTVALTYSTDGGDSWNSMTNHASIPSTATSYSVEFDASQTVRFKWQGAGKRFHLGPVGVYVSGSGGGVPVENQPPVLDLDPDVSEVTVFVGHEYDLEVTATEYDGDEITLSASGLPDEDTWLAEDSGTGSVTGEFIWIPETTGTWTVVFSATDKDGTTNRTVVFTAVPEGPGALAFDSDGVHVRESAGTVTLTVVRTNGAAGAVTVAWATMNGTAAAGSEYVAGGGALAFADGQTEATLSVALLDDTAAEENKSFTVTLGNVTGGASLGDITTCTVTIVDDDDANASYYASCYKNGVLKTGSELKDALCKILNTGVKTNSYGGGLDTILKVTDVNSTNGNSSAVRCIYLQSGITSFNKEHIWAQSHGIDESGPAYSDLHHIRACNSTMNSTRGDKDFDNRQNVSGATQVNGCWYTSKAWEPPDAAKGDVARAVLYMDVRYENKYNGKVDLEAVDSIGTSTDGNQLGKLSTLIAWNELDPPDAFERRRNELIYTTYQYNRNPFIDHPTWVRAVFDPTNFHEEAITWTVNVTVEGTGWVNGDNGASTTEVTNGLTKAFFVQPDAASYYHIGSISWNGTLVPQAYYTNASYYNYTCPAVTNNSTLAVVFAPDTAALGTPLWWLAQYGTNETSVTGGNWDAAELEDWNDDGVPNWQEYLNRTDPTALSLRQVTGVTVTETNNAGFSLAWNELDYADGYRVRVCSTTVVDAASAGFESGELDAGWTVSALGTALATNAALAGDWGLTFSTNGAWLCSPEVTNPASVEFKYKRSSSTAAWTLAVEVSADGGTTWTEAGSVTNATTTAKTGSVDLSAWYGQTVVVRLHDARESGNAARYVDAVTLKTGGATVAEATTAATMWTATGLDAGTGYDVFVRGEATTLGTAVGPWSAAVRATTATDDCGRTEQTITFPAIADQIATATVQLGATASSGLAVTYALDSGPAVLSGTTLTFTGAGTVSVTASQTGNEEYAPAVNVTRTFMVSKAPQSITFGAIADQVETATVQLLATAGSGLAVSFAVTSGPAVLDGTTLSFTGTGTVTVTASQAGNELWAAATDVVRAFEVTEFQLSAPTNVWASATNDTSFTAAWSAVTGAEGYELSVWTGGAAQTVATTNLTTLFNTEFPDVSGKDTALSSGFIEGWTCATAYKGTNEIRVGSSSAGGNVTSAEVGATGTIQVVTSARVYGSDSNVVMWVGVTGCESQSNVLKSASDIYTNTFEGVEGPVRVSWSNAVGKKRFYLEEVSANEIRVVEESVSGSEPVPGYETRVMAGTTCTVTGLTVATTYEFHVRAKAGSATGAWSETAAVTTLAQGGGEGQAQSITFGSIADQVVGATVTLAATASSGLPVTYSVSGPALLEGTTLTCTGVGTVTVTASQSGNGEWAAAADVERSFAVTAAPAELTAPANVWAAATNETTFTAEWSSVAEAEGYELTVWTGGGTETVTTTNETTLFSTKFESVTGNGNGTLTNGFIEGWMVTKAYAGTNEVRVGASSALGWVKSATVGATGTVKVVTRARAWSGDSTVLWVGVTGCDSQTNTLSDTSAGFTNVFENVEGAVTVCWSNATASKQRFFLEEVSASEIVVTAGSAAGIEPVPGYEARTVDATTCVVTGLTASTEYGFKVRAVAGQESSAWSSDAAVTTLAAKQPQTITFDPIANQTVGATVTLGATASSGLTVSYTVSGPATLEGNTLTCTGAGTVEVTASQAGNDSYEAAISVERSFEVSLMPQTIDFPTVGNQIATATVSLSATASSGLGVTFALVSGPAVLNGSSLTFAGAGEVTVTATQSGDTMYAPASASQTFTVSKASQSIDFPAIAGQSVGDTVTLNAMASSGLAVSYTVSGPATLEGNTLTCTGEGTVTVTASQVGNDLYAAAADVVQEFIVSLVTQSINFEIIGNQVATNIVSLSATADSGLEVGFAVTSGPAEVNGRTLTFTGAGEVTITVIQGGDSMYAPATASQTFTVTKAEAAVALGGLSWTYDGTGKAASVTTEPEGLLVVLTYDGGTELPVNAGSHAVAATVEDGIWAGQAEGTMVIAKGTQTILFDTIEDKTTADTVTLDAVASSGLEVSYSVSGPAQLAGTTLSFTGEGTVTVTASQAGDANWEAAADAVQSFEVTMAALTPQEAYEAWLEGKVADPEDPDLAYETATEDDADGDGVSNWLEYVADTDPTDGEEFLRLEVVQTNGTWFAKPVPASAIRSYSIVTCTDMTDDSTLKTNSFPAGSVDPTTTITNNIWFGTVRVQLEADE